MSQDDRGPTLTDPVGMGGVVALGGFDYQLWQGLHRLPAWLANPAFERVIFEGLEDVEARFFAPHVPQHHLLERLQAKGGSLTPSDVAGVFKSFHRFERAHPGVARVHVLVTSQLPTTLRYLARDGARVRNARPFYAPFAEVRAASDEKFTADLCEEFGEELGQFVAGGVEVYEWGCVSRDEAVSSFATALSRAFPRLDLGTRRTAAAFASLEALVRASTGVSIARRQLTEAIETAVGESLGPTTAKAVRIRTDRNGSDDTVLEIDASLFAGGEATFPDATVWASSLVAPLDTTAKWLRANDVSRIMLSGMYRLTTAFLVGRAFRSAFGFELDIPTKEGPWATDDRPLEADAGWALEPARERDGDYLVVSIGILRRPAEQLLASGHRQEQVFSAFLDKPMVSAKAAQAGVARLKDAIMQAVAALKPQRVKLYYAGPAAFAVALGHRWNAMPPTDLFEFDARVHRYVATASCN